MNKARLEQMQAHFDEGGHLGRPIVAELLDSLGKQEAKTMYSLRLSKKGEAAMNKKFINNGEAHKLLDLINAEFQSDPMSVQCFDLRIVERVKKCVEIENDVSFL